MKNLEKFENDFDADGQVTGLRCDRIKLLVDVEIILEFFQIFHDNGDKVVYILSGFKYNNACFFKREISYRQTLGI